MKISIIIPVINEEKMIGGLIDHLEKNAVLHSHEIVVVDGGSTDRTIEIANEKGAKVIHSDKGRSVQMNNGAKESANEILYFLHADSLPPEGYDKLIINAVKEGYGCGCFRMKFDCSHWLLRLSGWFTKFSSSLCRGGDQSLFVERKIFNEAGGFRNDLIIYEDNEILTRLRKISKFKVIQNQIVTSARRFHDNGIVRLYFIFMRIHIMHRLGTPHDKLLSFYRRRVR